jgi:hypothetical protein
MTISHLRQFISYGFTTALWGALAVLLAGCGGTSQSAVATVSASEAALAAAGRVVLACYSVPRCASVAPKPQIKSAYDAAYAAVTQAQSVADAGGTPNMAATTAAMSALQGLVSQLPQT